MCIYKLWSSELRNVCVGCDKVWWEVDKTAGVGTGQPWRMAEVRASSGGRPWTNPNPEKRWCQAFGVCWALVGSDFCPESLGSSGSFLSRRGACPDSPLWKFQLAV